MSNATKLKALRKKLKADRAAVLAQALNLAGRAENDLTSAADLEWSLDRLDVLDRRLDRLPKITKITEPDLYDKRSPHSFFADLIAAVAPFPVRNISAHEAQERLGRHSQYEEARRAVNSVSARNRLAAAGVSARGMEHGVQSRALAANVAASGGDFVPPQWLVDEFASVSRAAAPLRRLVRTLPLPDGTLELHIPRLDIASGIVPENIENTVPNDAIDTPTDAIVAPVRTFAGETIVSQQMYERGNFDVVASADFAESYAADLESQLINGTGSNGQLLGLLNVSTTDISAQVKGAQVATYTAATPTTAGMVESIAQVASLVSDARERPPTAVLLRPGRYFWLAGTPDGSTNVSTERVGTGLVAKDADTGPVGPVAGLPAYLDATIPADLGSGTNQDAAIVVRPRDILLLEDAPRFSAYVDTSGGASQLAVVLTYHVYAAAFTDRYPSAIGVVTGSGFVYPSGW